LDVDGALLAAIARVVSLSKVDGFILGISQRRMVGPALVRLARVDGLSLGISQPRVVGLAIRVWGLGFLGLGIREMGLRVRAVSARVVRPSAASFELTILKCSCSSQVDIRKLTFCVCDTNPSILQRESARVRLIGGTKSDLRQSKDACNSPSSSSSSLLYSRYRF